MISKCIWMVVIAVVDSVTTIVTVQYADACGRCWNVEKGELLDVIGIDQTGEDAGYAIKMDCTVDEKPNPPGSPLHLTCTERDLIYTTQGGRNNTS